MGTAKYNAKYISDEGRAALKAFYNSPDNFAMMDKIANGESSTILPTIMADFAKHNVAQYVNTKVSRIENDGKAVVATDAEGKEITINCDMVISRH